MPQLSLNGAVLYITLYCHLGPHKTVLQYTVLTAKSPQTRHTPNCTLSSVPMDESYRSPIIQNRFLGVFGHVTVIIPVLKHQPNRSGNHPCICEFFFYLCLLLSRQLPTKPVKMARWSGQALNIDYAGAALYCYDTSTHYRHTQQTYRKLYCQLSSHGVALRHIVLTVSSVPTEEY